MDLGSALRVLLRRWLIVLIGIVLTLGACGYLYRTAEPQYQASGSMLMLLPNNARGPENVGSPFLYLPNGLNVLARLVTGATSSREFRQEMGAQGLNSSFQVGVDNQTPIITMTVQGPDPENVIRTRDWLIDALNDELLRVQQEEGTPPLQTAHTRVYGNEDVPMQLGGDWTRSVLAALAAGGLATLIAAFGIDRLLALRKDRRARRKLAAGTDPVEEPTTPRADAVEAAKPDASPTQTGAEAVPAGSSSESS
ncbi:YveK family protein [Tessaracoccus terricola]